MKTDLRSQLKELQAELLDSLKENNKLSQKQLEDMQQLVLTISIQHRILRHLVPDDEHSRREQIYEANPDTCRWILEPAGERSSYRAKTRDNFIRWLRSGSNVLHISGNPGAGKSTLMKFISGNPRAQKELRAWAGSRQLVFGQFYFWHSGTEAQRTLPGMLRSLLFQALGQFPELIGHVFPRQWEQMKTNPFKSDPAVEKFQNFGSSQMKEAFDNFRETLNSSEYRVCFLIDGLDELKGRDLDHEKLASELNAWTASGIIKLLVSSRPWRPFLTSFTAHATLHLHELNRSDIETYAIRELEQDQEISKIGIHRMKETIQDIVEELVGQAQGIFLWAHLVLDTLREDIRRQYSRDMLKAKLREYPSDLDELYDKLREPIEKSPFDTKLSNRMLLLAAHTPKDFQLLAIAFSWLPGNDESGLLDPSFPASTNCQPYPKEDVEARINCVSARITSLTRGLLELFTVEKREPPKVRFCHRTARDYLLSNDKRKKALEQSWPGFDQSDPYGRLYLAELIYSRVSESSTISEYLNKPICRNFPPDTIRKFEIPMRPLLSPRLMQESRYNRDIIHSETASFLHYGAYCRLKQYILSEVVNNSGTYPYSPKMSILLASMYSALTGNHENFDSGNLDLAFSLIQRYMNRDNMIEDEVRVKRLHSKNTSLTTLPIWVAALILGLKKILGDFSQGLNKRPDKYCIIYDKAWINHSLVKACHLLEQLGLQLGQRLSVTVESEVSYFSEGAGGTIMPRVNGRRTIRAVEILDWANHLNSGIVKLQVGEDREDQSLLPYSGWVLDTIVIMRDGFPIPMSQEYRIVSWKSESDLEPESPTKSVEDYADFNLRVY